MAETEPESATRTNPFPGLRSFEPEEDHLFFGREARIDELQREDYSDNQILKKELLDKAKKALLPTNSSVDVKKI